jgi:hypothetical protein
LASTTEASVAQKINPLTTWSQFGATLSTALGSGDSVVFTWRSAGSDQALTCTIADPAVTCSDTTHSFTNAAGDLMSVKAVFTGTIVVTPIFTFAVQAGVTVTGPTGPTGPAGGGGTPGGSDGQLQFNNAGAFGGFGNPMQPNLSATGAPLASLPTSGWTVVNSAILNDFSQGMSAVHILGSNGLNWRFIKRTLTVPYTLIALIRVNGYTISCSASAFGLYLTDGTKLEGLEFLQTSGGVLSPKPRVETMTNVTTDSATVAGPTAVGSPLMQAIKITNNSTNRVFSYWSNGAWVQILSEASGTFLTENAAGPGGISLCNNDGLDTELLYWSVQ